MHKIITAFLLLLATQSYSQSDHNDNPVFNSITNNEETVNDFQISSNYYTLKNNIESKHSSVFISDNPSLNQILDAAVNLPSDFFVITKEQGIIAIITLVHQPKIKFIAVNPTTGKQREFDCSIKGEITENRALEIIKEKYDPNGKIGGNNLYFNDKKLKIISNEIIKRLVLNLIKKEKLSTGSGKANVKILSKAELKTLILSQTKEGGELDFFTPIKGIESNGVEIKPRLFTTNLGLALYNWGLANFELGVDSIDDALLIFSEFKGRELNQRESAYIKQGFNKELEK